MLTCSSVVSGQNPSLSHVVTHNRVTIVTNPKTGERSYPRWGVFPDRDVSVRKIILHLTLGTPDSMRTAHWDYCDNVFIRRQGSVKNASKDFEIARMLTPYGSIFDKGWEFGWSVDITDFAILLRDSVEIEYRHSGYEPDTVGWALTLDFEIIYGPPVMKPLDIITLWKGNYKYGDQQEKMEDKLLPVSFETLPGSGITRVRIQHTGHGMDEPRGCSEFCSRWRELYYDNRMIQHRVLWKDCGSNPLYPQGGTWVYDRANWCPGDLQNPDIINIPSSPGKHALAIKMEPYNATKNIQAVENICAFLIHYTKPLQPNDVAIEEIIVPNDGKPFNRLNPAPFDPRIIIRNLGSENLTSVVITYGENGNEDKTFHWTGNLLFNESREITLPGIITGNQGKNTFKVTLSRPNGKKDAWEGDNSLVSFFETPLKMPATMIVRLKTNLHPQDNALLLINAMHDTVYRKLPGMLKADSVYNDTLRLDDGQYRFTLSDTAGDGLEFWAEPGQGNGYLRFFDLHSRLIHTFESDCGNGEMLSFQALQGYASDSTVLLSAFSLYPRNVKKNTELEMVTNRPAKMTVIITIDGKIIERHEFDKVLSGTFPFYLGYLPKGRIVLEALLDGKSCFKGRLFRDL